MTEKVGLPAAANAAKDESSSESERSPVSVKLMVLQYSPAVVSRDLATLSSLEEHGDCSEASKIEAEQRLLLRKPDTVPCLP